MASILKVDEMQGVTSAGDITITSEGGSATTVAAGLGEERGTFLMVQPVTPVYHPRQF